MYSAAENGKNHTKISLSNLLLQSKNRFLSFNRKNNSSQYLIFPLICPTVLLSPFLDTTPDPSYNSQ